MLPSYKKQLLESEKETHLMEVIREENEIKDTVKGILYWTHNNSHQDMSKGHMISGCKKILEILKHNYDKDEFKGPTNLTNFSLRTYVDKPQHLAKLFGPDNKIARKTKTMLRSINNKFTFSKDQKEKIYSHCKAIFKEMSVPETELQMVFDFMGMS
tara:strand:+ start:710 stop:1180 length:471 start_codon:yes stop_codon:yes gene_type:complete